MGTVLAPANSAFDKHNAEVGTPIDADVLKYHVIEGKKSMDALNSDQKTLNGGTLTCYRKFRKNWPTTPSSASSRRARPSRPTGRRTSSATTASSTPSTRCSARRLRRLAVNATPVVGEEASRRADGSAVPHAPPMFKGSLSS